MCLILKQTVIFNSNYMHEYKWKKWEIFVFNFVVKLTFSGSLWLGDSDSWFNLSGHHCESLFNIFAVLSWGFKESDVVMFSEFLALISANLSAVLHIALVTDEDARNVVWSVLLYLVHPVLNSAETLSVCDVVCHNDTMSTLVIAACDSLESLLTCGIPL